MSWNDDRVARLKALWAEGYSASQIAARISEDGGPKASRHAILAKVDRLRKSGDPEAPARRDTEADRARQGRQKGAATTKRYAEARKRGDGMGSTAWTSRGTLPKVEPYVDNGLDESVPIAQRVRTVDLEERHCRWPIGDPLEPGFRHCGMQKVYGIPYCEVHAQRAFVPPELKKSPVSIDARPVNLPAGGDPGVGGGVGKGQEAEVLSDAPEKEMEKV